MQPRRHGDTDASAAQHASWRELPQLFSHFSSRSAVSRELSGLEKRSLTLVPTGARAMQFVKAETDAKPLFVIRQMGRIELVE
jgi:hypothetical protein